ncbi:MAG TPA: hypothetical protein VG096_16560 [Bryobacteraceae bacterium]|nr:hypothetical protein [Bryobacteraceae bacterium]
MRSNSCADPKNDASASTNASRYIGASSNDFKNGLLTPRLTFDDVAVHGKYRNVSIGHRYGYTDHMNV